MKFSIVHVSLLSVLTASTVAAYSQSTPRGWSTRLFYIDESKGMSPVDINIGLPITKVVVDSRVVESHDENDELWMESIAFSLGMNGKNLQVTYSDWAARHGKKMTPFRFLQWKRNYLMQEVWNRANGKEFDLNENGDLTKQEFELAQKQQTDNQENIQDWSRGAYWEEVDVGDTDVQSKTHHFKQVKTFSGGFRMVLVDENGKPMDSTETTACTVDPSSTKPTVVSVPPRPRQRQEEQPRRKRGGFWKAGLLMDPAIR